MNSTHRDKHSIMDKKPKQRENTGFGADSHEQKPHMNVHSIALEAQDVHVLVGQRSTDGQLQRRNHRNKQQNTLDLTDQEQKKARTKTRADHHHTLHVITSYVRIRITRPPDLTKHAWIREDAST